MPGQYVALGSVGDSMFIVNESGSIIAEEGQPIHGLIVIVEGAVSVWNEDNIIAICIARYSKTSAVGKIE